MNNHNLFYEILNGVHTEQISSKMGGDHIGRTQQNLLLLWKNRKCKMTFNKQSH